MFFITYFYFFIFLSLFFYFFNEFFQNENFIEMNFLIEEKMEMFISMKFSFSFFFLFIVILISFMMMFFSKYYMSSSLFIQSFFFLKLMFILSMMILILANSNLMFFLGWDGLGISSYFLVIFFMNWKSSNAGFLTILSNRVGDSFMLLLICSWIISFKDNIFSNFFYFSFFMIFFIIFLSITKSAQFPFSIWLPAAMAAPTPISALVHSSTLVTAGIYVVLQLFMFMQCKIILSMLFFFSFFTLIYSGIFSLSEMDVKKIIALSTLNQLAMIFLTLSFSLKMLSFLHLNTHAIFKSLLFVNAGVMIHSHFNMQDSRKLMGYSNYSNFCFFSIFLSTFSLMGLFFSSGFFSKDLILEKMMEMEFSFILNLSLFFVISLTFFYSLRFLLMFSSSLKMMCFYFSSFSKMIFIPIFFLSFLSLFLGKIIFYNFFNYMLLSMMWSFSKIYFIFIFFVIFFLLMKKKNYSKMFFVTMFFLFFFTSFFSKMKNFFNKNMKFFLEKTFLEMISFDFVINMKKMNFYMFFYINNFYFSFILWSCFMFLFLFF